MGTTCIGTVSAQNALSNVFLNSSFEKSWYDKCHIRVVFQFHPNVFSCEFSSREFGKKLFSQFAVIRSFSFPFPSLVPVSIMSSFVSCQFTVLRISIVAK